MTSNAGFLLDSMFDFAERFNRLNLSDDELAIFSAIVLLSPGKKILFVKITTRVISFIFLSKVFYRINKIFLSRDSKFVLVVFRSAWSPEPGAGREDTEQTDRGSPEHH